MGTLAFHVLPVVVVVVLSSTSAFAQPAPGLRLIPIAPGGYDDSRVQGLNYDGTTAAGLFGSNAEFGPRPRGYRWNGQSGVGDILYPPDATGFITNGISYDGQRIAGTYAVPGQQQNDRAFVTNPDGSITMLGTLPERQYFQTQARAISADGIAVWGFVQGTTDFDRSEAMVWTAATGIRTLGYLDPNFDSYGDARAVSNGGRVVVGETGEGGFVWTEETGMQRPPTAPGIIDLVQVVGDVNPAGNIYLASGRLGAERAIVRYTDGIPELLFSGAGRKLIHHLWNV